MSKFNLTPSQTRGYDTFLPFYLDPNQSVMLLKGYSGTGKTTLVRYLMEQLPIMDEMAKLVAPGYVPPEILLTATTNQAAEAFSLAVNYQPVATTIYKACQLRLVRDYKTKESHLIPYGDGVENKLLFIDEASFLDSEALGKILAQCRNCKIVFIGDPAQLTPVGSEQMPVFEMNACEIELTDLVRFTGGVMESFMGTLRAAVMEGNWSKFPLTPGVIDRLDRPAFNAEALRLFTEEKDKHVKILAYTNDRVTAFNNWLSQKILGSTIPIVGQKMLVNEAVQSNTCRLTANEEVTIETIEPSTEYSTPGHTIRFLGKGGYFFMPLQRNDKEAAHATAVKEDDYQAMKIILDTWVELRPAFAQTINKSQGSTYDIIMIDLDDVCSMSRTLEQLARLLYVGLSRARMRIIMTGDLRRK
ncbi:DNA helicase [Pseudomonas phage phCDa]|uniref:DNA helicase n=1 Tax=Pseudomonas phage phCDa TaxID=2268587 RepID=A0A2Z5H8V6_9CAUD|nr:DNA helicase [Pseudomonas phage phCDa]AXC36520.1 DNA helicase [Pseudomonas phage phCDa]